MCIYIYIYNYITIWPTCPRWSTYMCSPFWPGATQI